MTSSEYVKEMIEILNKKYKILKDILGLTTSQTNAINNEEFDVLEKLVHKKQVKINLIEPLDERFNFIFAELKDKLGIKSMKQLTGCNIQEARDLKELTIKVLGIIAEIGVVEKQNNEMMLKIIDESKKQIKSIIHGKKALSAYSNNSTSPPSYYIDKKK